ncbi:Fmp41p [Rhizophagus irregularis DAOM 197198w]|uniref:Fmp41p n=1 Tax=Rhizophagus irregularis (strain DAOM 197198w) TaxID=1432141 RepID=A0A015I3Z6_RHIIW|nr:Fmp41p [Rhizophagus irregularis DAOM 197198w]
MQNFTKIGKKIVGIGRNFSEHAKELGNAVPTSPFFFLKPTSSYLLSVELGVVIGKDGRDIRESEAMNYVEGYALGIDLTARNLQEVVKKKGLPWSAAKGFDTFTPIGKFIPKSEIEDPHNVNLWLKLNGEMKQNGITKDMIFNIPTLIEYVSSIMKLEKGDLILTGKFRCLFLFIIVKKAFVLNKD